MEKGRWIYAEFAVKFLLWFLLESGVGIVILFVVWQKYGTIPFMLAIAAVSTWVVWRIVAKFKTARDANRCFEERKHHP